VKIILFANTNWYLFNFRLSLAKALQALGLRWEALPMDRKSLNPLQELRLPIYLCRRG